MRPVLATVTCAAALALAVPSFAQSATAAKPATATTAKQSSTSKPAPAKAASAKPAKATTMRSNGKLTTFDPASMMLTLSTSKGSQQYTLTSATKIEEGSKTIDGAALSKLTGHEVTVSYSDSGGQKMVQSVHVSAAAPKKS
ncbi:MAG TPA: hypothetical protein VJP86_07400 [Vicinamibacterales bacterium]|jgi:hypothetical protein|nr:hypothetical protein [Vicinamibacterales bacterium]